MLLLIGFVTISPFVFKLLFGECGTFRVAWGIRTYETYAIHLAELEHASRDGELRPPPHLFAQVDKDREEIEVVYDKCLFPASGALYDALIYASEYFNYLPLNGQEGDARVYEAQKHYEVSLKKYENEIEILKACHPFCNIEADFDIKNSIEYVPIHEKHSTPTVRASQATQTRNSPTVPLEFHPTYPYVVRVLSDDGPVDIDTTYAINNWLGNNLPADTYYWFIQGWEQRADGTMIVSLIGMRLSNPDENWASPSEVYPAAGSEIIWSGRVAVHGHKVTLLEP